MKNIILFVILTLNLFAYGQTESYEKAYSELESMLEEKTELDFKKALFTIENAWFDNTRNYSDFEKEISEIATICKQMVERKKITDYKTANNWAIFMYLTQKIPENDSIPYSYDFEDFLGNKNFNSTFVTRLIKDKKGNCLSLPLLYKCIAQDLKTEAKLTLGPSHAWIRHTNEDGKFTNVELTSGQFPTDGILITELDIKREAIKTGAYFKPLNEKETIAFLLTQLALSYENKFGKFDLFTEKCTDLSIQYYKPNVIAYSIKMNKVAIEADRKQNNNENVTELHQKYLVYQNTLNQLGADNIKPEDYNKWVSTMKTRKK